MMQIKTNEIISTPAGMCILTRCNRCRRKLKTESSVVRGTGPICAKRGIKALGDNVNKSFQEDEKQRILEAFSNVVQALKVDDATLDNETEHREKLESTITLNRVALLEVVYGILADTTNQMPQAGIVADSIKSLFSVIGAPDEGDIARKRLIKLAQKTSSM